jgi:hypothetical protein
VISEYYYCDVTRKIGILVQKMKQQYYSNSVHLRFFLYISVPHPLPVQSRLIINTSSFSSPIKFLFKTSECLTFSYTCFLPLWGSQNICMQSALSYLYNTGAQLLKTHKTNCPSKTRTNWIPLCNMTCTTKKEKKNIKRKLFTHFSTTSVKI